MPDNPAHRERAEDAPAQVRRANDAMRKAWNRGRRLVEEVGMRAEYGAGRIEQAARRHRINEDTARKYRQVADRMNQDEIEALCAYCEAHARSLGPTYLIAFSRVRHAGKRKAFWKETVRERWSLIEVRRELRKQYAPQRAGVRTGRKRLLDWSSEADILAEIDRLCESWARFAAELEEDAGELDVAAGLDVLTSGLRDKFIAANKEVEALALAARRRLERVTR